MRPRSDVDKSKPVRDWSRRHTTPSGHCGVICGEKEKSYCFIARTGIFSNSLSNGRAKVGRHKSSVHDAPLKRSKIKVILSLLSMTHGFKPSEFYATCCRGKIFSSQQNVLAKTGISHEENCPCNMSPLLVSTRCPDFRLLNA